MIKYCARYPNKRREMCYNSLIDIGYLYTYINKMNKEPETILEWQAPEFRHYPKNGAWFITFALVIGMLITYLFFQQDWFGGISVLIIAILVGVFAMHRPNEVTIRLSTYGVHIDDTHIPYTQIKEFWIVDTENHKTLNINTTAYLNHLLSIELQDQNPNEVQEILEELLDEKEDAVETVAQRIAHRVKF